MLESERRVIGWIAHQYASFGSQLFNGFNAFADQLFADALALELWQYAERSGEKPQAVAAIQSHPRESDVSQNDAAFFGDQ